MFEMNVPYDKGQMKIKLEDKNLAGVLEGRQSDYKTSLSENEIVEQSLDNPIGSKSLEELAKGKKNVVIISSDHTRPVPSKIITPILLRRIRSVSPDARIRILVATGFHRESTHEELVAKYGEEIVKNEEIVMHVSTDDSSMVKIGQLPSGGDCIINKVAAEADLLISEGFIEAHFFAGFSGGRKSVLYHNIADVKDPEEFEQKAINTPRLETVPDQWTSQICARILAHHKVIMVSDLVDPQLVKDMHMDLATTVDEALQKAFEIKGKDAKVAVIPDGLGVVVNI